MGDAINPITGRHLSGRPAGRGAAQTAWDQANPNYFTTGAGSFLPSQQTQQMADSYKQRIGSGQTGLTRGPESLAYQQVYGGGPGGASNGYLQDGGVDARKIDGQIADPRYRQGPQSNAGGGAYAAYRPGQAQSQQSPYANSTAYGQSVSNTPNVQGGQMHSFYSQPAGQGPAFQQQMPSFQFAGGTDWMGNQYTDPNAMMAQTGAMALALNQQRQGMMGQGQFGSLNPQMAYNQGMEMLQQGWQNPFAQQPQDPGGNIRDLIQGPQPGKPGPTPGLPSGLYRPDRMKVDRGPDWHTTYYNPSTGETFDSYKNTVRPEEGSGWVNQGRQRTQEAAPEIPDARGGFTPPGQAQPAQDPYGSSTPYRINDYDPMRSDYGINETMYRPWMDKDGVARDPMNGERDMDMDGVVDRSPPPGGGPGRPINRPPPTAEQFRQDRQEQQQRQAVNDLYRRANLQPGASTDELMLGLINNSRGGTLVRPEEMAGLPADIRGAVSQYQDLAGMAQGLDRSTAPGAQQRRQDIGAAMEQMKSRMTERAQASQALQRDYGMSPADATAWVNREMPMQDQAATMRGLEQKQAAYLDQARSASLDRRAKQEMEAAKPKAPSATDQWNQIRATTNTQTKPLSPAHQRVYDAMVAEQWKSRGRDDSWTATGSPIANLARARNKRRAP